MPNSRPSPRAKPADSPPSPMIPDSRSPPWAVPQESIPLAWAGANKDFNLAMTQIEKQLSDSSSEDFSARFVCALSLAITPDRCQSFIGTVHGTLSFPPRGTFGFGYDPIFVPNGDTRTFGEFHPAEKHAISHRALAFSQLVDYFAKL